MIQGRTLSKVVMEIRLIPWDLTSDDLEGLKSRSYFLTPNMWKMATVTMLDITEVVDTGHRLYFGWPCGVKGQGHNPLTQNISKTVTDTRLDPRGALTCRTNRLSIGAVTFDLGWPWGSKIKVKLLDVKYVKKRQQLRCWTHRLHFGWPWEVKGQGHKRDGNCDRHVWIYASRVNWRNC